MRRRECITILGGALAWPLFARAQQRTLPIVGFMSGRSPGEAATALSAFRQGLGETGYFEGKNVTIEYRWAEGRYEQLPAIAADLVSRQVAVLAATGGESSALAAKAATGAIPIVFTIGSDPVRLGLVASLNSPGANITGVTFIFTQLGTKRLELLRQLIPKASLIGMLVNPNFAATPIEINEVQDGARSLGLKIEILNASNEPEIDAAFTSFMQQKFDALIIGTDPFLLGQREQIVRLAERSAVPTFFTTREFVEAGGLISYGPNIANGYRQAGVYTGRILGGASPRELPVLQPTSFALFINLKTAKALGLTVPPNVLALADEVIE